MPDNKRRIKSKIRGFSVSKIQSADFAKGKIFDSEISWCKPGATDRANQPSNGNIKLHRSRNEKCEERKYLRPLDQDQKSANIANVENSTTEISWCIPGTIDRRNLSLEN